MERIAVDGSRDDAEEVEEAVEDGNEDDQQDAALTKAAGHFPRREPRFGANDMSERGRDESRDSRRCRASSEPLAQNKQSPGASPTAAARSASASRIEMPGRALASPSPSAASDKENENASSRRVSGQKRAAMETTQNGNGKRRRTGLSDRDGLNASQMAKQKKKQEVIDSRYYDPDQSKEERREVRKGLRERQRYVVDQRTELMNLENGGLRDKFKENTREFKNVKQTDDATIDSKMQVYMGDLAVKAVRGNDAGGDGAMNVDEFISQSIAFMRRGPSEQEADRLFPPESTQRLRHHRSQRTGAESDNSDAEDEGDDGDALNWEWLGRKAALPFNMRPPAPVLFLGPLSVQKKIRKVTQRVARQRLNPEDALRPDELKITEIERNGNADLVGLCKQIHGLLEKTNAESTSAAEMEIGGEDDPTDEEMDRVLWKYNLGNDGGTLLVKFAFDPKSFGQTVENLFYLSFLIKEGKVGLGIDDRGLQTLHRVDNESKSQEAEQQGGKKHQGVFHLDYDIWEKVVKAFDITASIIEHREDSSTQANVRGWYG